MKHLELNIAKIALIGEEKEEENYEFRAFLKGQDSKRIDKIVHRLDKEISSQIDCQTCGNCCKTLSPCVSDSEVDELAKIDKLSTADFASKYLEKNEFENIRYLKDTPCKYLNDKSCSIYKSRPNDCKSFPHTDKKNFNSRTIEMIVNYSICPIVFNLFERLKQELDYL